MTILADPNRRTSAGNTPRWLGSGLYECGVCGATLHVWGQARGRTCYRCPSHHVVRSAALLDEFVVAVLSARLSRPDAVALLPDPATKNDVADLRREAASLREPLNEQARLHARGVIDAGQLEAGSMELRNRLRAVEDRIGGAVQSGALRGLAGQPDAAALWPQLDLGRQRAVLRELLHVTVNPAVHGRLSGGSYFDPSAVALSWKSDAGARSSESLHA